jgi:hypothetical protein
MAKGKQFTIEVENRPGTVAEVARILGDAKVNILALLGMAHGAQGSVYVVVDNARKAKSALDQARCRYSETTVDRVVLPNKPGALARHLELLARKGVNLGSVYATASKGAKKATVVLTLEATGV